VTPVERCVALLAGIRGGQLIPRPSFFQLDNTRKARARGEPWHLIVHEDILIFRAPAEPARSPGPAPARPHGRADAVQPVRLVSHGAAA
jgi:modification methylase